MTCSCDCDIEECPCKCHKSETHKETDWRKETITKTSDTSGNNVEVSCSC